MPCLSEKHPLQADNISLKISVVQNGLITIGSKTRHRFVDSMVTPTGQFIKVRFSSPIYYTFYTFYTFYSFYSFYSFLSVVSNPGNNITTMKNVAKTIAKRLCGVLNTEALNSKIRLLRIKTGGYRKRERFKPGVAFHFGKPDISF